MVLAIVDVGSNTVRLLVARRTLWGLERLHTAKARVGLGADVELLGRISNDRLAAARKAVRRLCSVAREHGAESIDVLVTSPGRQAANAPALLKALERGAGLPVRVLSAEEEASLAYAGAVALKRPLTSVVAVCDMGGASTEVAVGSSDGEPTWLRSADLGALRLTARCALGERPARATVEAARSEAARAFAEMLPPLAGTALAVGGSARALAKLVGPILGEEELAHAVELLATETHQALGRRYGVHQRRLRVLLGGALILSEVQRRVVLPLEVVEAGLREGAILATAQRLAA